MTNHDAVVTTLTDIHKTVVAFCDKAINDKNLKTANRYNTTQELLQKAIKSLGMVK
jgi:hypothetical protein